MKVDLKLLLILHERWMMELYTPHWQSTSLRKQRIFRLLNGAMKRFEDSVFIPQEQDKDHYYP